MMFANGDLTKTAADGRAFCTVNTSPRPAARRLASQQMLEEPCASFE
jgi:hypothetical protein